MKELGKKKYNMVLSERSKVSTLSSGKPDRYEYLTGDETFPLKRSNVIEQARTRKQKKVCKDYKDWKIFLRQHERCNEVFGRRFRRIRDFASKID